MSYFTAQIDCLLDVYGIKLIQSTLNHVMLMNANVMWAIQKSAKSGGHLLWVIEYTVLFGMCQVYLCVCVLLMEM